MSDSVMPNKAKQITSYIWRVKSQETQIMRTPLNGQSVEEKKEGVQPRRVNFVKRLSRAEVFAEVCVLP